MADLLLDIDALSVTFDTAHGPIEAVRKVSLDLRPGETLAIVGESGSGKSTLAKALIRLNQAPFTPLRTRIEGRAILHTAAGARDLVSASDEQIRRVRISDIAMISQDVLSGLNPVHAIGKQVDEAIAVAQPHVDGPARRKEVVRLLDEVGLPNPEEMAQRFPHQLSGGQRQRVMIAMAVARRPSLIIADEPTTALDVTVQARILRLLKSEQEKSRAAMIFITHDLGVVARVADRVAVMNKGQVVETAPVREFLTAPRHPYTAALLAAVPGSRNRQFRRSAALDAGSTAVAPAIEVRDLSVVYSSGIFSRSNRSRALDNVSLSIPAGCTMGIVGESGSGKSTLGRVLLRMLKPTEGRVAVNGRDPFGLGGSELAGFRKTVQAVFQDSGASLDPRQGVGTSIREGLDIHHVGSRDERRAKVVDLLDRVGLDAGYHDRLPHTLSGGQRQRINIARALALSPSLLIADEPVSALDTSVQAQILELLAALRRATGLTMVFISHDLGVVRELCDRVAIMHRGKLVEEGDIDAVFDNPRHEVTQALLRDRPTIELPN